MKKAIGLVVFIVLLTVSSPWVSFGDGAIVKGRAAIEGDYGLAIQNSNRNTVKELRKSHPVGGDSWLVEFLLRPDNARLRQDDTIKLATVLKEDGSEFVRVVLTRGRYGVEQGIWVMAQITHPVDGAIRIEETPHYRIPEEGMNLRFGWMNDDAERGHLTLFNGNEVLTAIYAKPVYDIAAFTIGPFHADGLEAGRLSLDEYIIYVWKEDE